MTGAHRPRPVVADPADRRAAARVQLGVTGTEGPAVAGRLGPILRSYGLGYYPLFALGLLGFVDTFQSQALVVVTPEVSQALGLSLGAIGFARALQFLATALAPLPMAALSQTRGRRGLLCLVTALGWSVITLFTGFVTSLFALIVVLVLDGLSTGSVLALHPPMLADTYPPRARVRVLSAYRSVTVLGQIVAPLMVSLLAGPLHLTWRGVFLGLGVVSLASSLVALGIRDPKPGQWDTEVLHSDEPKLDEAVSPELGFFEIVRRLMLIPTIQRLTAGALVFGILTIPFTTFLSSFLQQRWNLSAPERGYVLAITYAAAIVGLSAYAHYAERLFSESPAKVVDQIGWAIVLGVVAIAAGALVPSLLGMVVCFSIGQTMITLCLPGLNAVQLSIVDARYRPHAAALIGLFIAFGAIFGVLLLSGVQSQYGVTGSIVALVIPGVAGGLIVRSAKVFVSRDIDRMIDAILEEQDLATLRASGGRPPMLSAKGINFSYGQLQVLFGVDFSVDAGEMVALLGTNGAGKSTLLKVISGIGLPSAGTVRLDGGDITYLDPERRVKLGVTQIPGGRAVFGRLTVVENLRGYGYTLGADRRKVDEAIERCLTVFPRLEERKGSLAATLSGGEQQMLGLCKALLLKPRLLLIDELSLGLAPVIVAQLLDLVREINAEGTAIVLVEQSVNIALSLVDHAYFMEKGQMRFDGAAKDLLGRGDLLRAVFLEGATSGAGTR